MAATPLFIREHVNHALGSTQETIIVTSTGSVLALRRWGHSNVRPAVGLDLPALQSLLAGAQLLGFLDPARLGALARAASEFLGDRGAIRQRSHVMCGAGVTTTAVFDTAAGRAVVLEVSGDWNSQRTGSSAAGGLQCSLAQLFHEIRCWKSKEGI
eukprot:m51a1_g4854 hypothetical protein (156) ;mRNA; f:290511-290978